MAFQFPWTNLHELNLDWFLSKFKQFTDNYLGTTATAESVPNGTPPSVTVTGGELDDDTDIVDPFTFNFKIPAGAQGEQGVQGVPGTPGQDGFSPIATVTKSGTVATITITDVNGTTTATISDGEVTQAQLDTKAPAIFPTVSGSIANFSDGADDLPMSELTVDIVPVQSGSGNPAPDNIRPISGWTGATISHSGADTSNPDTLSISWQNEAGTVYGGTLDVKTGVLTVTHSIVDLGSLEWEYQSSSTRFRTLGVSTDIVHPSTNNTTIGCTCSSYKETTYNGTSATANNYSFGIGTSGNIAIRDERYTTESAFTTAVNGVTFVYPLSTPLTYQLTPQQLFNTLYGVNNVWSDTGDSTVTYTADTMLYIQNLTQPTEDDMIANTSIANGKFFMIGNNLYKATTAIASGSQIIPGTNATPLSLADALNLL